MEKIAVFIERYSIGNSPSILNFIELLSEQHHIDLYIRDVSLKRIALLKDKKRFTVIDVPKTLSLGYVRQKVICIFNSYKSYITFDPHGFCLCKSLFPKAKPIYYSLELYMKKDHFGLHYPENIMNKERKMIKDIKGLIIQSEEKAHLFKKDYSLPEKVPTFILPVTYKGSAIKEKSNFLREKYGIGQDKKIALHLGGIAEWFCCIELAIEFSKLENWILVFHGYANPNYLKKFKQEISRRKINNLEFGK